MLFKRNDSGSLTFLPWAGVLLALLLTALPLVSGCSGQFSETSSPSSESPSEYEDAQTPSYKRVAVLYHSYLELWELAGGEPVVGIVDPDGRELPSCGQGAEILGTVGTVNTELLLSLQPDFVIVSQSMNGQEVIQFLDDHQIPWVDPDYNSFSGYLEQLKAFCALTGKAENYETYGTALEREVGAWKERAAQQLQRREAPTVLHIFASGKGIKVRFSDSTAGSVLEELGADNLSDQFRVGEEDSQLLSIEKLIELNPDFIFVQFMGSSDAARELLNETLFENPALESLTALTKGQILMLPRELFHYKPNQRFAESYQWMYDTLYEGKNRE